MINLMLQARSGDQKPEATTTVDTGFATVEEVDLGTGSVLKRTIQYHESLKNCVFLNRVLTSIVGDKAVTII